MWRSLWRKKNILTVLDQPFNGSVASILCCGFFVYISFSSTLSSLGPLHVLPVCRPLISVSLSHFSATPQPFFPSKTAYFLLLRKAELTRSQTSLVDEGKYIILTKEQQTDVFTRVCLEDVAQRCRQEARVGGGLIRAEKPRNLGSSRTSCLFNELELCDSLKHRY